ncbi:hypothetical protein RchiOBHm_Chr1g0367841 [Rosa chinensis]|uniref:Uncharacterized protein n=1 Tax=Rosa chinensis TaxID=74649 RepID=A0A2P6SKL4_ROSCH|nr:hypothetical protein RchiOBHm_Chr1g0367841 [Rosa chinensis]
MLLPQQTPSFRHPRQIGPPLISGSKTERYQPRIRLADSRYTDYVGSAAV